MINNESETVRAYLVRNRWERLRITAEELKKGLTRVQVVRARIAKENSLARAMLCGCLMRERALRVRIIRNARAQGGALLGKVRAFYRARARG